MEITETFLTHPPPWNTEDVHRAMTLIGGLQARVREVENRITELEIGDACFTPSAADEMLKAKKRIAELEAAMTECTRTAFKLADQVKELEADKAQLTEHVAAKQAMIRKWEQLFDSDQVVLTKRARTTVQKLRSNN